MTESRLDFALHTILVRIDGEWVDVRFVDGHRGLKSAAWVIHDHAMVRIREEERQRHIRSCSIPSFFLEQHLTNVT